MDMGSRRHRRRQFLEHQNQSRSFRRCCLIASQVGTTRASRSGNRRFVSSVDIEGGPSSLDGSRGCGRRRRRSDEREVHCVLRKWPEKRRRGSTGRTLGRLRLWRWRRLWRVEPVVGGSDEDENGGVGVVQLPGSDGAEWKRGEILGRPWTETFRHRWTSVVVVVYNVEDNKLLNCVYTMVDEGIKVAILPSFFYQIKNICHHHQLMRLLKIC